MTAARGRLHPRRAHGRDGRHPRRLRRHLRPADVRGQRVPPRARGHRPPAEHPPAMDLVARDAFNAGAALPTFAQVFTRADPGRPAESGPAVSTAAASIARRRPGRPGGRTGGGEGPPIPTSSRSRRGRAVSHPERLQTGAPSPARRRARPASRSRPASWPGPVLVTDNTSSRSRRPRWPRPDGLSRAGRRRQQHQPGPLRALLPWSTAPALPAPASKRTAVPPGSSSTASSALHDRPQHRPLDDPSPALWRSQSGRYNTSGVLADHPGEGGFPPPARPGSWSRAASRTSRWSTSAADDAWTNQPPSP